MKTTTRLLALVLTLTLAWSAQAASLFRPGDLPAGLQGYWKFDGNATDASPNGYNLANVGTPGYEADNYWATGEQSGSQIDANYWSIPDANCQNLALAGTSFSIAAWIKMDVIGPNNMILRKWATNVGYSFRVDSSAYPTASTGYLAISFGGTEMTTQEPVLSAGKWHHVAFVYDKARSVAAFYVDGNCVRSITHAVDLGDNSVSCDVGYVFPGGFPSLSLKGNIKDLAVWNRALSPLEVKSLAFGIDLQTLAYRPGNLSVQPTAWWKLNEFNGTRRNTIKGPHPIFVNGSDQVDTGQSVFGGGALQQLGNVGDYLRTPMADGFNFGPSDFTIEYWIRFAGSTGGSQYPVIINRGNGNDYVVCGRAGEAWYFGLKAGNVFQVDIQTPDAISPNVWYHVAFVRQGSFFGVYRDGQLKGSGATYAGACPNFTSEVDVGASDGVHNVNGWMDEVRISKGIARYTANFTPPAAPFTTDANTSLLLHLDGLDGSTNITDSTTDYSANLADAGAVASTGGYMEGVGAKFAGNYLVIEDNQETALTFDSQEAAMTVSLWIRPDSLALSTIGVLSKVLNNGESNGYSITLNPAGAARFWVQRGGVLTEASSPSNTIKVGGWYHIVGVHDPVANQVRVYVDGTLRATAPHTAGIGNTPGSRFTLGVNSGAVGGADYYSGQVADAAIWRHVLTDAEIKALAGGLPIQSSGIVSYWPLDEASGTRNDSIGTNHLTNNNGVGSAAGMVGSAADFEDSLGQSLSIADAQQNGLDLTESLSITFWMKPETATFAKYIVDKQQDVDGYGMRLKTGGPALALMARLEDTATNTAIAADTWYHGAGVLDGKQRRVFLNSVMETATDRINLPLNNTAAFRLGARAPGDFFYDGLLDEVIIARRWFRDEEIKTIYIKGLNGQAVVVAVPLPPTVTTSAASVVTSAGAMLNGTVNPIGQATTASFEWGTDTNYGNTTTAQNVGSGNAAVPFSAALTGLAAHTTYHFRAVATNATGTSFGGDAMFTTVNSNPVPGPDAILIVPTIAVPNPMRTINPLVNDTDPDGDTPLTVTGKTDGAKGTVAFTGTSVTYTPVSLGTGTDIFTYTVSDGHGGSAPGTVKVYSVGAQAGFYAGFISDMNGVDGASQITMSSLGALTGRIHFGGLRYSFKGQVDDNGEATIQISRNEQALVLLHLALVPGEAPTFLVEIEQQGSITGTGEAQRSGTNTPGRRRYTLLLPPDPAQAGSAAIPQGTGYASVSFSAKGKISIAGATGDGAKFSTASALRTDNTFPFFAPIYGSPRGEIYGTVAVRDVPGVSDLDGVLTWTKPVQLHPKPTGPASFTTTTAAIGSLYVQPKPAVISEMLAYNVTGDASVAFTEGNLASPLSALIHVGALNPPVIAPPILDVKFRITNGLFVGNFTRPGLGKTRFQGAVFQKQNRGAGYFLGTDRSGAVGLTPAP